MAATAVTLVNANTVDWSIPSDRLRDRHRPAQRRDHRCRRNGQPGHGRERQTLVPYSYTFFTTNVAPYIVSSSVDGQVFSPAPADVTEVVTFSQPMDTAFTTASSFDLYGNYRNVHYAAASFSWDPTGTMLTINYTNLPDDTYTLTLFACGFQNLVGIPLASDYVGQLRRGAGHCGLPDAAHAGPAAGRPDLHRLGYPRPGDTDGRRQPDSTLNAGGTLTLTATPTTSALQLTDHGPRPERQPIGTATASAQGQPVTLETVPIATTGTYTIQISDANGNIGLYSIQAYLNSYLKRAPRTTRSARRRI